ncbi:MAG: rhodanese-like domain-containing protein [Clostridia bacterium]|nr:rhodanese-like domain-containing protein [Clostridia bacterium]
MKRFIFAPVLALCLLLCSCSQSGQTTGYVSFSQEKAKQLIDSGDCIILDVRTPEEYNEGHIPGAVLIPDYDIKTKAEQILTDKNALILVYCRSGRRSKNAARELAALGYTNVKEFGGIIDWPYDIEK